MNPIAERLRNRSVNWFDSDNDRLLDLEAADEIDRMQKVLDAVNRLRTYQKAAQPHIRNSVKLWDEVLDALFEYHSSDS